jgi:hypothetical protein
VSSALTLLCLARHKISNTHTLHYRQNSDALDSTQAAIKAIEFMLTIVTKDDQPNVLRADELIKLMK